MEIGAKSKPHEIFEEWMAEAKSAGTIREPTAMTLSTISAAGDLHSRVVLCKEWPEAGFKFYTNYQSLKGLDLAQNPNAAGLFYWDPLAKQIKISGKVEKIQRAESEKYWATRPRESQLSQYISHQSQPVESRADLEKLWSAADLKYKQMPVPCPSHWGGYLLRPQVIEFWIGRANRLHDSFRFEKQGATWTFRRLCP